MFISQFIPADAITTCHHKSTVIFCTSVFYVRACVTCGSFRTGTGVRVLSVLAGASVSAGLAQALIYVGLAQAARVSGATITGESGHTVPTHTVMTRAWRALVDVQLTVSASKPCRNTFEKPHCKFRMLAVMLISYAKMLANQNTGNLHTELFKGCVLFQRLHPLKAAYITYTASFQKSNHYIPK